VAFSYQRQRWLLYQVRRENGSDVPAVIADYALKCDASEAARQLSRREKEMQDALWDLRKEHIV
jgi:hypothetical protein